MTKKLLNVDELSEILQVPRSWIYERTRQGQDAIPHIKLGSYVRFELEEVLAFFKRESAVPRSNRMQ